MTDDNTLSIIIAIVLAIFAPWLLAILVILGLTIRLAIWLMIRFSK